MKAGTAGVVAHRRWGVKGRKGPQVMWGRQLLLAGAGRLGVQQDLGGEENRGSLVDILHSHLNVRSLINFILAPHSVTIPALFKTERTAEETHRLENLEATFSDPCLRPQSVPGG